jgi:hypothetical protein
VREMKSMLRYLVSALGVAGAMPAYAYEVGTHARMSLEAFNRSQISNMQSFDLFRLGILSSHNLRGVDVFGKKYYDIEGTGAVERSAFGGLWASKYDTNVFTGAGIIGYQFTIAGWVARGAIREDDYPSLRIPPDDRCNGSGGPCFRVFHHFYDPYNDRALEVSGLLPESPIFKSPVWGLGSQDPFAASVVQDPARRNHFSLFDAREAMYRALTLRSRNEFGHYENLLPAGSPPDVVAKTQMAYWATTFRALGNVVHLVQDMAQPQHTRNDSHSGFGGPYGERAFYEEYIDARVGRRPVILFDRDNVLSLPLAAPDYGVDRENGSPYPIVSFNRYSDFWTTSRGAGSLGGKGLGDYSSRGFYTTGTNVGSSSGAAYPQPTQSPSDSQHQWFNEVYDLAGNALPGTMQVVVDTVGDTAVPAFNKSDVKLASHGLFDQFLVKRFSARRYTLNHYNYDDNASLLIPRAVSYTAGLLNYFFRGRLSLKLPAERIYSVADFSKTKTDPAKAGFDRIKVMVQNVTPPVAPTGEEVTFDQNTSTQDGTLVAVLRYRLNTCIEVKTEVLDSSLFNSASHNAADPSNPLFDEKCRKPDQRQTDPRDQTIPPKVISNVFPLVTVSDIVRLVDVGGIDGTSRAIVFTFPQPLPFNAIDVDLQVVYRGRLGTESDGMAVGFESMSEPTFFDFNNFTDCRVKDANTAEPNAIPCASCFVEESRSLPWPSGIPTVAVLAMPSGRFARAGFLTHAGERRQSPFGWTDWVMNNQDYAYDVPVLMSETLEETWPAGRKITGAMFESRKMPNGRPMMTWMSQADENAMAIPGGTCLNAPDMSCAYNWMRDHCPAITNEVPWPIVVEPTFWTNP